MHVIFLLCAIIGFVIPGRIEEAWTLTNDPHSIQGIMPYALDYDPALNTEPCLPTSLEKRRHSR